MINVFMSVWGGGEQCVMNSSLCWGPGQHLLTANSGMDLRRLQNRTGGGWGRGFSTHPMGEVESDWSTLVGPAGHPHNLSVGHGGWGSSLDTFGPSRVCLDETMRGTQSCTSRLVYKEALTCSLPNKYY